MDGNFRILAVVVGNPGTFTRYSYCFWILWISHKSLSRKICSLFSTPPGSYFRHASFLSIWLRKWKNSKTAC